MAELYACVSLMIRGASVFKNTGCDGKTDLCFKYEGQIYEIDVKLACYKTKSEGRSCWETSHASKVKLPVYPLIVVPATGIDLSGWYCRWKKTQQGTNHCPLGLENFWD